MNIISRPRVHIVGQSRGDYHRMFTAHGWDIADSIVESDLVQFLGGADVTPSLYGHTQHRSTQCNPMQDKVEKLIYLSALKYNKPMAGICRGGQFLNVMNKGSMWQDVDKHCGTHKADWALPETRGSLDVTSTHHQMMIPASDTTSFSLLMVARLGGKRVKCSPLKSKNMGTISVNNAQIDIESLFYHKTKSLCFQPHPEFEGQKELSSLYFKFINTLIMDSED